MKSETEFFWKVGQLQVRYFAEGRYWIRVFESAAAAIDKSVEIGLLPWYERLLAYAHLMSSFREQSWRCYAEISPEVLSGAGFIQVKARLPSHISPRSR
jgi:hypothetical protein